MSSEPTFMLDMADKRPDLPEVGFYGEGCPKCGSDLEMGYGMAGGGMGAYEFCDTCGEVVTKSEDKTD